MPFVCALLVVAVLVSVSGTNCAAPWWEKPRRSVGQMSASAFCLDVVLWVVSERLEAEGRNWRISNSIHDLGLHRLERIQRAKRWAEKSEKRRGATFADWIDYAKGWRPRAKVGTLTILRCLFGSSNGRSLFTVRTSFGPEFCCRYGRRWAGRPASRIMQLAMGQDRARLEAIITPFWG